jgi:hypothetical protein
VTATGSELGKNHLLYRIAHRRHAQASPWDRVMGVRPTMAKRRSEWRSCRRPSLVELSNQSQAAPFAALWLSKAQRTAFNTSEKPNLCLASIDALHKLL